MNGQDKLLDRINNYTIDNFPKSSILLGENGCGKHLLTNYIAEKLKLQIIDISNNISLEYLDEIYLRSIPAIYLIDSNMLTERHQNIILKFIEEPLNNSYILLLCENKNNLLDTIKNRCIIFEFQPYTKDFLKLFVENQSLADLILNVSKTPGQVKLCNVTDITSLYELCNKIVDKLSAASFNNTLTISDKINYKDEYDKFDLNLFYDMLIHCIWVKYYSIWAENNVEKSTKLFELYKSTIEYKKRLRNKVLNKQYLFENYLINIWIGART